MKSSGFVKGIAGISSSNARFCVSPASSPVVPGTESGSETTAGSSDAIGVNRSGDWIMSLESRTGPVSSSSASLRSNRSGEAASSSDMRGVLSLLDKAGIVPPDRARMDESSEPAAEVLKISDGVLSKELSITRSGVCKSFWKRDESLTSRERTSLQKTKNPRKFIIRPQASTRKILEKKESSWSKEPSVYILKKCTDPKISPNGSVLRLSGSSTVLFT